LITQELDVVKIVKVKVEKILINVLNVKEKDKLFKCSKWDQECINKFKKDAMTVKDKDKLLVKEENAKHAMEIKSYKKLKKYK